ncbi:MAG: hypothetical protein JJT94_09175 [Bernardetiaceae bacterium]|nr:hypothetical protein [Bernardetiaceae bacterium]
MLFIRKVSISLPKLLLWLFALLVALLFLLVIFIRLLSPGFYHSVMSRSDLEDWGENVYVHPDFPSSYHDFVRSELEEARARVVALFGSMESSPVLIIAHDDATMRKYGRGGTKSGLTHFSPIGTYIVVGEDGANVDVIAHELCHAELAARLGWWLRYRKLPTWFDEGLAMQLDGRFPSWKHEWGFYTLEGRLEPPRDYLKENHIFFSGDVNLHYIIARKWVDDWFKVVGQAGLLLFIEKLKTHSFEVAYEEVLKEAQD